METEEITVKTDKKQNIVLKKFCMFCVALLSCLIATASSSWMSAKGVVAVGGVPVLLNEVTQADIDDAKERRDAARAEADEASEMISQLEGQRTDLEGELSKLNEASDAQREQYVIIYGQLEAALEEQMLMHRQSKCSRRHLTMPSFRQTLSFSTLKRCRR